MLTELVKSAWKAARSTREAKAALKVRSSELMRQLTADRRSGYCLHMVREIGDDEARRITGEGLKVACLVARIARRGQKEHPLAVDRGVLTTSRSS